MNNSERATKISKYDKFIGKYGNSKNFNDAKPLLEDEGIISPSKEVYKARIWHDKINKGKRQQEKQ